MDMDIKKDIDFLCMSAAMLMPLYNKNKIEAEEQFQIIIKKKEWKAPFIIKMIYNKQLTLALLQEGVNALTADDILKSIQYEEVKNSQNNGEMEYYPTQEIKKEYALLNTEMDSIMYEGTQLSCMNSYMEWFNKLSNPSILKVIKIEYDVYGNKSYNHIIFG